MLKVFLRCCSHRTDSLVLLAAERRPPILSVRLGNEDGSTKAGAGAGEEVNMAQASAVESEWANEVGLEENSLVATTPRRRSSPRGKSPGSSMFSDLGMIPLATKATTASARIHPGDSIASDEPKPVRFLLAVGYRTVGSSW
jgi:hypothetical protein